MFARERLLAEDGGEIGLRRSVGASRRAIGGQFLVESGLLGLVGGLLGTVLGIDITAATSLYPAVVAARLRPADALHLG